eukprot:2886166-Prymnesium_polylepis.1
MARAAPGRAWVARICSAMLKEEVRGARPVEAAPSSNRSARRLPTRTPRTALTGGTVQPHAARGHGASTHGAGARCKHTWRGGTVQAHAARGHSASALGCGETRRMPREARGCGCCAAAVYTHSAQRAHSPRCADGGRDARTHSTAKRARTRRQGWAAGGYAGRRAAAAFFEAARGAAWRC